MKKRRTLIIALLLVAALCLGIGYAAVTDVLDITGVVEADAKDMEDALDGDVYFSAIDNSDPKAALSELVGGSPTDNATFMVSGLATPGETVSVTYTITSDYEQDVWVSLITPSNPSNEFISVEYTGVDVGTKMSQGDEIEVIVTATLLKATNENVSLNYGLQLQVANEEPTP